MGASRPFPPFLLTARWSLEEKELVAARWHSGEVFSFLSKARNSASNHRLLEDENDGLVCAVSKLLLFLPIVDSWSRYDAALGYKFALPSDSLLLAVVRSNGLRIKIFR